MRAGFRILAGGRATRALLLRYLLVLTAIESRLLDILNERFARGEIDRAEHEDRRRALQDGESR